MKIAQLSPVASLPRFPTRSIVLAGCIIALAGCRTDTTAPPRLLAPTQSSQNQWGPETPKFNLEVVLRGDNGFGLVKFRQPNDDARIVNLDVWVRDLQPGTEYVLQRAADKTLDGVCSGSWLTLGRGATPQSITTDDRGTGRESLFRDVSPTPVGTTFDISFRVVNVATSAVVLTSDCYRYTVSQ